METITHRWKTFSAIKLHSPSSGKIRVQEPFLGTWSQMTESCRKVSLTSQPPHLGYFSCNSLDWKEGLTKKNKVCASVPPRKGQKNMIDKKIHLSGLETAVRTNSMRGARIEGPITHRSPLVDREPMKIELAGNTFFLGVSTREKWMRDPNSSKTDWSIVKQW